MYSVQHPMRALRVVSFFYFDRYHLSLSWSYPTPKASRLDQLTDRLLTTGKKISSDHPYGNTMGMFWGENF
jgi:hypothetical protein